jgi:hypothetical protein
VTAQESFTGWLRDDLAPWMKERGFRRRDATFRRRRGEDWQIVNVQRSKWADSGDVPFTLNLGVALAVLRTDEPPWSRRGWPLEYECDFRARLSTIVRGDDHWWRIRARRRDRKVADEVRDQLEQAGLPWLELHVDQSRLLAELVADPSSVDHLNLGAFVALAEAIGAASDVETAKRELAARRR